MVNHELPMVEFTAEDRCDRCGAQAYTLAQHEDMASDLLFCIHHRKQHHDALLSDGWEIIDDYEAMERLVPQYPAVV